MRRDVSPLFRMQAICVAILLLITIPTYGQQQRQTLPSHVSAPGGAQPLARIPDSQQMNLSIVLPLRNQLQLQTFLQALHNPASTQYGKFLTVQQFAEQFGPTAADYNKVIAYAKAHGMSVTRTYQNRTLVNVSAPVAAVNQAFHVTMHNYQHPTENRQYFAPDVEPTIDPGLPILNVQGFSNLNQPHSMLKYAPRGHVQTNQTGSGQGDSFWAAICALPTLQASPQPERGKPSD